jgi:hypothetical protein
VTIFACVLVSACGDEELDRGSFQAVHDAAMRAVAAADLDALWPLLTERGRQAVERELRGWQERLRDPEQGAHVLRLARENLGVEELDPAEIERARYGSIEDAWRFFLRVDPRSSDPPQKGLRVDPGGDLVVIDYENVRGEIRQVRLVRKVSGWYIDDLQL